MSTITLKNLPPELHARLRASAVANRRSLNSEILATLEARFVAPAVDIDAERCRLAQFVEALPYIDHALIAKYRRQGRA
jgi:plasmid stability protein